VVAGIGPAQAQLQTVDIPASAFGPSWTGFYVGAAFGAGALDNHVTTSLGGATFNVDGMGGQGVLASIYGGLDFQILPRAVVGVLAEGTYSSIASSLNAQVMGANASPSTQADWSLSLLVRAGVLFTPSTLLYGTGGYTGQNLHTTANAAAGGAVANMTRDDWFNGWTIGSGIETRIGGPWTGKLEYRYSQFETRTLQGLGLNFAPNTHAIRAGLTYRFGAFEDKAAGAPPPEQPVNWTGFYGGVAAGAAASVNHVSAALGGANASADSGSQGLLGSVFVGADYQFAPQVLAGVMGDLTWPGSSSITSLSGGGAFASVTTRPDMAWSVLARLGFLPTPSTLPYAAGGYTRETFTTTATAGGDSTSRDDTLNGWTVGPGIEMLVSGGWSTRLEYRYSQFEQITANGIGFQPSMHTIRAGLSYKFGVPPTGSPSAN
jgi:outer membrane immunogenic protein